MPASFDLISRTHSPVGGAARADAHNLPAPLTRFVGRRRELAELQELLIQARLLTLTGVGGVGKTRLAVELAADVLEAFPDGVWLVELARLDDPGQVPAAVARVLHVHDEPGRPLTETLVRALRAAVGLPALSGLLAGLALVLLGLPRGPIVER